MERRVDLLHGEITPALTKLAIPIMATSFVQMAYNMIDMIWIGKVGSGAVAAVGAAGMFTWLSSGLSTLARVGGQVKVGHSLGAQDSLKAKSYTKTALQLGIVFAICFGLLSVLCADAMIAFFKLHQPSVIQDAKWYLQITCGLVIFQFMNQILTGILTAMGNSRSSFIATSVGLVINLLLDPVFIFGFGFIPAMGVSGAAIATVFAQFVVFLLFLVIVSKERMFQGLKLWRYDQGYLKDIVQIGTPMALQSMLFSCISMVIARLIAEWGDGAVAVQKVGSQIESISWMTADGFAAAVNAFVSQNHGAGKQQRVKDGYRIAFGIVSIWGLFCSLLLICFPEMIFRIFLNESDVLPMGVDYLRILGVSELFMCVEITTAGAFSGMGKTIPPSMVSIVLTSARIPCAYLLSTTWGLNGVWWSISISSIAKGIILAIWFIAFLKQDEKKYLNS